MDKKFTIQELRAATDALFPVKTEESPAGWDQLYVKTFFVPSAEEAKEDGEQAMNRERTEMTVRWWGEGCRYCEGKLLCRWGAGVERKRPREKLSGMDKDGRQGTLGDRKNHDGAVVKGSRSCFSSLKQLSSSSLTFSFVAQHFPILSSHFLC